MSSLAEPTPTLIAELRLLARTAWPVIIGQLAVVSMYVTDNILVGHVGKDAMAGLATGLWWFISIFMPLLGALRVMDPLVSQAIGAGDERASLQALARGAVLAALGTAVCIGGVWLTGPALRLLNQPAEAIPIAVAYSNMLIPGIPAAFGFFLLRTWLQARGEMRPGNVAIVVANGANIVLAWSLIYGRLGLPELGAAGAGVATSIGNWLQLGIVAALSWRLWWPVLTFMPETAKFASWSHLLPSAVPLALQSGTEIWAFSLAGWMAGWVSAAASGAHLIAINLSSLSFNVALGMSVAAGTRVGQLIGAGHGFGRTALAAHVWGVAIMGSFAVLFALFPGQLSAAYTDDVEVLAVATALLPIAAMFQLFDGAQVVAFGILRSAGDVKMPTFANLAGYWVVGLPLGAWLLLYQDMGAPGVWWGLVAGLGVTATILLARVRWVVRRGGFRVS